MLAIVTGASRGLGRRCARRLAAAGADLLLVARDSLALAKVADEAITRGGPIRVSALGCDLTDREAPEILRDAAERLGGADILVNNAAIQGPIGQAWEVSWRDFEAAFWLDFLVQWEIIDKYVSDESLGYACKLYFAGTLHIDESILRQKCVVSIYTDEQQHPNIGNVLAAQAAVFNPSSPCLKMNVQLRSDGSYKKEYHFGSDGFYEFASALESYKSYKKAEREGEKKIEEMKKLEEEKKKKQANEKITVECLPVIPSEEEEE